jgi:aminoglycoside phosphotransferase (APT) family kinase protein
MAQMDDRDARAMLDALKLKDVSALAPVQGGSDTSIWRVESASGVYALRVLGAGYARGCAREVAAMRAAGDAGIPVPRVWAIETWQDRPVLLLSWMVRAQPWRAIHLGTLFGRMHARIHAAPAPDPSALGQDTDAWIEWANPGAETLTERLRTRAARPDALLHCDYHPLNVLTDGRRITGVLDWANASIGDARADAARTVSILRADVRGSEASLLIERGLRRALEWGWRRGYEQVAPLGDLTLFYAWAGAVMEHDLAPKRDARDRARIHRWAARWEARAARAKMNKLSSNN